MRLANTILWGEQSFNNVQLRHSRKGVERKSRVRGGLGFSLRIEFIAVERGGGGQH